MNIKSQAELNILTSKAQADKAINSLKGILSGILIDDKVNEDEVQELQAWAKAHKNLIERNPFKEFIHHVDVMLKFNEERQEIIEDMYWLCHQYEDDNIYYNAITTDIQMLQGICHGILSDGVINDLEINQLHEWLESNSHLSTHYPYDELRSIVLSIVADGVIDDDERLILKAFINQFVNLQTTEVKQEVDAETSDINIFGLCTSEPSIEFKGANFCCTGNLSMGSKSDFEQLLNQLGATYTKNLTLKTDYLIVGDNGNPAWAFACYGRKVEKAIELRKKGHQITLIHEFDFLDIVEDIRE